MGLMAIIDLNDISTSLYDAFMTSSTTPIINTSSQVAKTGQRIIAQLGEELRALQETAAEGRGSDVQEAIADIMDRIRAVQDGMMAAGEEAWQQTSSIQETPYETFMLDGACGAFKSAFDRIIDELCPVRTGYLKSTCSCFYGSNLIVCIAGAEYAQYVEYGTSRMMGHSFFEPAIQAGITAMEPYLIAEMYNKQGAAQSRGRTGSSSVVSAAGAESDDLFGALGGVTGFIMGLLSALISALFNFILDLIFDINVSYSVYIF